MTPLEATVVRAVCKVLDAHGAVHFNLGASNGETGLPDRIAFYKGRALALECKRPKGGRVSPKQRWMLDRLAAQGVIALVVTDAEQVRDALRRIDEEHALKHAEHPANTVESGTQVDPALLIQPGSRHPNNGGSNAR